MSCRKKLDIYRVLQAWREYEVAVLGVLATDSDEV